MGIGCSRFCCPCLQMPRLCYSFSVFLNLLSYCSTCFHWLWVQFLDRVAQTQMQGKLSEQKLNRRWDIPRQRNEYNPPLDRIRGPVPNFLKVTRIKKHLMNARGHYVHNVVITRKKTLILLYTKWKQTFTLQSVLDKVCLLITAPLVF